MGESKKVSAAKTRRGELVNGPIEGYRFGLIVDDDDGWECTKPQFF